MPDPGRSASAALTLAETLLAEEDAAGSILFVTDGIDPGDIAAFPEGGSARAALIVAPGGGGSEVADWSRRAGVATVAVSIDDGDVRAVERALASSLARAAAAEGRLQDDGWLLALPAGLLMLLWFRRGTTLRWSAMLLALALLPRPRPRRRPRRLVLDPRPAGPPALRRPRVRGSRRDLRRPPMARRRALPRRQVRRGRRDPRADPDLSRPVRPRHRAGPRPRLPGRGSRLRGGAEARPAERRRGAQPRRHPAHHRLPHRGPRGERRRRAVAAARLHRRGPLRRRGQARPHRRRLAALRERRRRMDALGRDQARRLPEVPLRHRSRGRTLTMPDKGSIGTPSGRHRSCRERSGGGYQSARTAQPSLRKNFFSRGLPSQPGLPRGGRSSPPARYGLPPPSRSPR